LIQRLRTLRPAQFDAIWLEQTHTGSLLPFIDRRSAPVVLVTENVEHDVRRQEAREKPWSRERARITLDSARLRRFERRVLSQVDAVTVVSEEDGARFARLGGLQRVVVIPNGVDPRYFAWHDHTENRRDRLLFTAHMGYPPNRDGCLWMCNTVMPEIRRRVPAAQLRLVGVGMGPEVRGRHNPAEGVEVVGEVDDVRPYMEDADLYVIPLRVGGGTRLKALEALAVGLPVVTTSRGVEGLGLTEAGLVVVADTPADFAAAVARVLGDRAQREHRIRAGRRFVEERYDWRSIAGVLEAELHRSHHRDSSTRT
jgi:glycosyltransferase involved in cell wall biosynthesis